MNEACSLPGDGLWIKGRGDHAVARALEARELVRVACAPDAKACVHVTAAGRKLVYRIRDAIADLLTARRYERSQAARLMREGWRPAAILHAIGDNPEAHGLVLEKRGAAS